MSSIKVKTSVFLFFSIFGFSSYGNSSLYSKRANRQDQELIQSGKCMSYFRGFERKYNIPTDLLHSISLQESGRKHSKLDKTIPWPWTVNIEGKGYYFDSKKEAVEFVKQQQELGKKSIDVGCMQINLRHHPNAFKNIHEAFEPRSNINYGASFLREKYEQHASWKKAIANYHSANEELGSNYHKSVLKIATNIDKHKFNYPKTSFMLTPTRVAHASSSKNPSPYLRQTRYKSNMMVHVPRNAYK